MSLSPSTLLVRGSNSKSRSGSAKRLSDKTGAGADTGAALPTSFPWSPLHLLKLKEQMLMFQLQALLCLMPHPNGFWLGWGEGDWSYPTRPENNSGKGPGSEV